MRDDQPTNLTAEIDAKPLKRWLTHLNAVIDEARVNIHHDGFAVTAVDPANVGMVDADLSVDAFDSWHYDRTAAWPTPDDDDADDTDDDETETCAGERADGEPCEGTPTENGYCHQHQDQADESDDDADDAEEPEAVADGGEVDGDDDADAEADDTDDDDADDADAEDTDDTDDDDDTRDRPPRPSSIRADRLEIGVNVSRLRTVLAEADDDETVTLELYCVRSTLIVRYGGHEFTVRLIDPDSIRQEPDLPDLDLCNVWSVDAGELQDAVTFCLQVTDHVLFRAERPYAYVLGNGDTDEYERMFTDEIEWQNHTEDTEETLVSGDYISDSLRPFGRGDTLTIHHGHEFPIRIEGEIPHSDGDDAAGEVEYMIAPRVQS